MDALNNINKNNNNFLNESQKTKTTTTLTWGKNNNVLQNIAKKITKRLYNNNMNNKT